MASGPEPVRRGPREAALAAAAFAATAALVFVGTGLHPQWPATWLAPVPVLLVAPGLSRRTGFLVGAGAWFVGGLNMWSYLSGVLLTPGGPPMPVKLAAVLAMLAAPAVLFGLAVLAWRGAVARGAPWRAALVFPAVWTAGEFIFSLISPHATFGSLAYSQMDALPLIQVASVAGLWGVSFCLMLAPAAVAGAVHARAEPRRALGLIAGVAAVFAAVLGLGVLRLATPTAGPTVRAGLVASDVPRNTFPQEAPADVQRLLAAYADQADALARQGARVVVLPEKLAVIVDPDVGVADRLFQPIADRTGAEIVVGLVHGTATGAINEARVYRPVQASASYAKQHLLPPFEGRMRPGSSLLTTPDPAGLRGVAICKDMDFPSPSRGYGAAGAGLLLVPAWDFVDDAWLHDRMAVMRGVEYGFAIVRSAKTGLLSVSDNRGRVLAERSSAETKPFTTLIAEAPTRFEPTLYGRIGDVFAGLAVAGVLANALLSLGAARRG